MSPTTRAKRLQIAIDGPVAAGKGTIAAKIAQQLGILYVDTGAMYRAVALLALTNGVAYTDEEEILALLQKSKIEFRIVRNNKKTTQIFLNGKNISDKIRTQEISRGASIVATLPKIRQFLVRRQQDLAAKESVVMEGRDITTKVLPQADLKIYLTAAQEERARRRQKQLAEKGIQRSFAQVLQDTIERDERDLQRKVDPLTVAPDAFVLDTTNLSIEEVVKIILTKLSAQQEKNS